MMTEEVIVFDGNVGEGKSALETFNDADAIGKATPKMKSSRYQFLCSWFEFKSKAELEAEEIDEDDKMINCYSFLALGCGPDNRIPFAYGLMVFAFQIAFLVLMICSKVNRSMSANEDIDNPNEVGFAEYMPANASLVVRTTQFVAIFAFVIFAEDSIGDAVNAVRFLPLPFWSTEHLFVSVACFFSFAQGILACFTVFLLVMTSEDVIDIVLNFTAVNFISNLDDTAFDIAKSGRYGDVLKKQAIYIDEEYKFTHRCLAYLKDVEPEPKDENGDENEEDKESIDIKYQWYLPTVSIILALLLGFSLYVADKQQRDGQWEAGIFRVEFSEETGLLEYSGCFNDVGRNEDRRAIYRAQTHDQQAPAVLEYCKLTRRWVFYEEPDGEPTDRCSPGESMLVQSTKTNSFSVTTAFELNWLSAFKKPLEVYFLEGDDEDELFCDQFADDGRCDTLLNNFDYQFDGGDCCGMTCDHDNCGTSDFTAFNTDLSSTAGAIGFPLCEDPETVALSVSLSDVNFEEISRRATEEVDLDKLEKFWKPTLDLKCGEDDSLVFSIPITRSMFGQTYEGVRVESEADCVLTASNFEPFFGFVKNYVSVKDLVSADGNANVDVVSHNFIPADFEALEGDGSLVVDANLEGTIPTMIGSLTSLTEVNLGNNDLTGTVPREIGSLVNLKTLVLTNNKLTGPIPSEIIKLTDLTTLILSGNAFKGTLPSDIALLTKLTYLDLRENELTGLVPTEIQSLPNLIYLYLNENGLKGGIDCSSIPNIWDSEVCQSLNSFPRWDSESPTLSPAPSEVPTVSSAPSVSAAPTSSAAPTVKVSPSPAPSPAPTESVTSSPTESKSPSESPTESPTGCRSIAEILCNEDEFENMCEFMKDTENAEIILSNASSSWTIFAPINNGFGRTTNNSMLAAEVDSISLLEPKDFWYHAVQDSVLYKANLPCTIGENSNLIEMANGLNTRTLCDEVIKLPIGQKGRGNARPVAFLKFDTPACNGVIHTIADVLLDE